MKANYLFLAAFFCVATIAKAQTDTEKKPYKNDIGFNTAFILEGIFNSYQTPFSLMYKKYTSENSAIRLGADINANWNKADPSGNPASNITYVTDSYADVSLALGKEFQKKINTKWIWYYGGDLVPSLSIRKSQTYQSGVKSYESNNTNYGLSARPFLGIRFAVNDRLYVSAEASLSSGYKRGKDKRTAFQADTNTSIVDNSKNDNVYFSMSPASGLFLYYRF